MQQTRYRYMRLFHHLFHRLYSWWFTCPPPSPPLDRLWVQSLPKPVLIGPALSATPFTWDITSYKSKKFRQKFKKIQTEIQKVLIGLASFSPLDHYSSASFHLRHKFIQVFATSETFQLPIQTRGRELLKSCQALMEKIIIAVSIELYERDPQLRIHAGFTPFVCVKHLFPPQIPPTKPLTRLATYRSEVPLIELDTV